jgi:hypothetical protein
MLRILPYRMAIFGLAAASLLVAPTLTAQQPEGTRSARQAMAVRVPDGAIELDGVLNEAAWEQAVPISDFVQKEPTEGASPTQRTEVRIVYESSALYVGARMHSSDPTAIQAPLGGRDQSDEVAEYVLVSLDTFLDRRTAYTFGVTASGVRLDRFHPSDQEDNTDDRFDPVWEARTQVDEQGWTAELWIPFTQLRFNDRPEQVWGLNLKRFIPTLEEQDYWIAVPRTERAWASRFGDLHGIEGVSPSRRVEVLPFVVGSSTMNANRDRANPFDDGRNLSGRAGVDLKLGVGPNLTLDATVNPDFGQVEADPAEVNLSGFESRFPEKRPFFSEGAQLFSLRQFNAFYSRRIGSPPVGRASGDFVDRPSTSRILSAAKLTGRLPSGMSLGVLAAVTDDESAEVANLASPGITKVRVAPRVGYGVAKIQQELGSSGSNVGFLVGGLHRDMGEADPLASLIARNAMVVGTDGLLRFGGGEYEWSWAAIGSYVQGEPAALERIQRSSTHFMQRPDRDYWPFDPTRTSLPGWGFATNFERVEGRHWLFNLQVKLDGPTLEVNELGQINSADGIEPRPSITYRETRPGRLFRSYSVTLNQMNEWGFGGDRQQGEVTTRVNLTWLSFWTSSFSYSLAPRTNSASLTRGGPLMGAPRGWRIGANFGNPQTAQTRWSGSASASGDELGGTSQQLDMTLSMRPSPRLQLSLRPSWSRSTESQQYVATLAGGRAETYGSRYVFAFIDRSTFSSQIRLSYVVKPDLTLEAYAEPFAASGRYYDHGELLAPSSLERITYGGAGSQLALQPDGSRTVTVGGSTFTLANADFNVRSFNSNVVVKWEWRPGSTVYLVWQQSRNAREPIGARVDANDMLRSLSAPGTNILLFKTSFWVPVG